MAGLQFKENLTVISGGYAGEEIGSTGITQDWTDVPALSGSDTVTYYYRDSGNATNANSSRVDITVTETWSAVFNDDRSYTVTVRSVVDSIVRGHINGNPGTSTRKIVIKDSASGSVKWSTESDAINNAHTLATNIDLGTTTFTLQPNSGSVERSAIYLKSGFSSHFNDPVPSAYIDELWIGIGFRNTLPPDYRPMKIRNSNNVWLSCNRTGGKLNIRTSTGSMKELRTVDGGTGTGNPPSIRHSDGWKNQRLIGQQ